MVTLVCADNRIQSVTSLPIIILLHETLDSVFTEFIRPFSFLLEVRADNEGVCAGVLMEIFGSDTRPYEYRYPNALLNVYNQRHNKVTTKNQGMR